MCTTGARDPVTSALHIILGRKLFLDAMQVVRWKTASTSTIEPYIRYAASFAGSDTGFMVMSFQKVKNIGGWVPNAMTMLELRYS